MSEYSSEHKVPPYKVVSLKNNAPNFYELVGPFLSRREVVRELGGPMWDDDDKVWFVAITESDEVLGTVAIRKEEVCSLYVVPGSRGRLVAHALLRQCLSRSDHRPLRATATESSRALFIEASFTEVGTKGRYFKMERQA